MTPHRQRLCLLLIGLSALLLRLAPLARPDLKFQTGWDAADYIPLSQGIEHGCGFARYADGKCGSPDVSRPPGYPFFIAIMPGLRSVLVSQAVLGAALCIWLGWFVAARWGGAAGLAAAALLAIDVPSIVYGGMIMSDSLFQFLLAGAILLQLSAVIADELTIKSVAMVLGGSALLAAAAMVRPTGIFLPLFAAIPFFLIRGSTWRRALALALLAFAIPAVLMLVWVARNRSVAGMDAMSTDPGDVLFHYNAPGVLAYATNQPFNEASAELAHEIGWHGDPAKVPPALASRMMAKVIEVYAKHPVSAFVVTLRGLVLVAGVPDRNELNELIGTKGGGPLGLPPSFDIAARIRRTLNSPLLTSLVLAQLILVAFVWGGVARSLLRCDWSSKVEVACILVPLAMAFAMLLCAASPDAHARFRVPAVPFLAMLASIGWFGNADSSSRSDEAIIPGHQALSRRA